MRGVHVDAAASTTRAAGGATWGDVDRETQLFGLATPGGVVSTTGIAGLTLHGGYGHLRRKFGLSIDNLISVQVVTADGQVRTASPTDNPDLFWAVRGAGSNFGVVTSFEFRAHPVGPIVQLCAPFYALEDGGKVLRAWREFTASAPDEISSLAVVWSVPDVDEFPAELRRRPVVILAAVYVGPPEEGARIMQPLRELATPLLDMSGPIPFTALQTAFDPFFPKGRLYYWKSTNVHELSDVCIDTIVKAAADRPSHMSDIPIWHLGGALARVAPEATAYGRRDAPYLVTAEATWTDSAQNEKNINWARRLVAAMKPFSRGGLYLNFAGFGEEKEAMLRDAYGQNYDRLVALKMRYDPGNLFRMNLNIPPVPSAAST
jgi:FAD/FMN-containing dehydrogenase